MAEVLIKFSVPVRGSDQLLYWSQVCGRSAGDGLWEGWLEFEGERTVMRTARESEQPSRHGLMYWAQGLTMSHLEGALERARQLKSSYRERVSSARNFIGKPRYDAPAEAPRRPRPDGARDEQRP